MQVTSVRDYCRLIQTEVFQGLAALPGVAVRQVTVRLGLDCAAGSAGDLEVLRVVPEASAEPLVPGSVRSWVTLELGVGSPSLFFQEKRSEPTSPGVDGNQKVEIVPTGGDPRTLRRRLELVLGGPPGFTTGAKAEMLADLLREFGTAGVLEAISKEWVTQFDTGIESSPSVG
jgi:hypothetical protein